MFTLFSYKSYANNYKKSCQAIESQIIIIVFSLLFFSSSYAGPAEQQRANYIHERLTGLIPSNAVLQQMELEISGTDTPINGVFDLVTGAQGAALVAMDNDAFYNATLKNWVAPWTNRDQDAFVPLNDYTATVIGLIRDESDFREVLFDDVVYTSNALGLPAYAANNNEHFETAEALDVSLKDTLTRGPQIVVPTEAAAGVMTTRAAAEAFFIDGTNRAMFRFTFLNYMCRDLEQVQDNTSIPDRIRQDVSRSPGGDSRVFLNNCVSCHSGMDPMAQSFAYYDFDNDAETIVYNNGVVDEKYHINATTFPFGFVTPDDKWDNYWRDGPNSVLGWGTGTGFTGTGSGNGAKSMGAELANSEAFAQCQVEKVFKNVCLREPINSDDLTQLGVMTTAFKGSYNLKNVFAATASYCSQP
jgi:hypothetical protein